MSRKILVTLGVIAAYAAPASAQIDPLLFLKRTPPNVILVVDTSNRMQRDAPTDPSNPSGTSTYYDPFVYTRSGAAYETTLNVTALNTLVSYRRKYVNMVYTSNSNGDKYAATTIQVVRDKDAGYSTVEAKTRMSIARAAMYQAISENTNVARFGLIKMRQNTPKLATLANSGPVSDADLLQQSPTDLSSSSGRWSISRPSVSGNNGATSAQSPLVKADANGANNSVLTILNADMHTGSGSGPAGLLPAGNDDANTKDNPVKYMLDDAKTEATRLINADTNCANTIVVLITGGGEGNTAGSPDPTAAASGFVTVAAGRRVPIYVVAIAPPSADVAQLQGIATNSGGQYFEITKAQIDAAIASPSPFPSSVAGTVVVPEAVGAITTAVQHAFADTTSFNTAPTGSLPFGPLSEFQVTSPIIGSVNLTNALDISGQSLPNTQVYDKSGTLIPQRSNIMVTTGFTLPGFDMSMRAFRVYKPQTDSTQLSGWKFVADGTRLWLATTPAADSRNLYTALSDGTMVAFNAGNAAQLAPLMNLSTSDATTVINYVRSLPLGPVADSTPAIMNAPSLDPPPDDDYPGFASANKNRRSIIFVGTNRGILEGIDARLGVEVWGFIPTNLLPKLKTLRDGQPVGSFDFMMDGSPKISDVKIDGVWKTHMIIGEGAGGTFYQSFDVTMSDFGSVVDPTDGNIADVLNYFASPKITLNWSFPSYSHFDATVGKFGELGATATAVEKTVGQTWSDPAIGQVGASSSPYTILLGSGFLPYSTQQLANRGGIVAGTTFYLLDAKTGTVFDSRSVGSDGTSETVDNCATLGSGCTSMKNALQSDPVATGPSDSRFIDRAYMGDLDGSVWRFNVALNSSVPAITGATKLIALGASQAIFNSMATVNVSGSQYIFVATGSDLLTNTDSSTIYHMDGILDNGASGTKTFDQPLVKTKSGNTVVTDERATSFPAVAGDIVFFTTTTLKPSSPCTPPDANLYAFTFIGGPAYDNTGDGTVGKNDTPLVKTIAGKRATAPFIVDQHLIMGTGGSNIELFGDPQDFNNGVGQAGVRILSWRQVR